MAPAAAFVLSLACKCAIGTMARNKRVAMAIVAKIIVFGLTVVIVAGVACRRRGLFCRCGRCWPVTDSNSQPPRCKHTCSVCAFVPCQRPWRISSFRVLIWIRERMIMRSDGCQDSSLWYLVRLSLSVDSWNVDGESRDQQLGQSQWSLPQAHVCVTSWRSRHLLLTSCRPRQTLRQHFDSASGITR